MKVSKNVFSLLICIGSILGCSASDDLIPVSGTVLSDEKPLVGASIAFIGNSGGAISSAVSNAKGEFKLRTVPGQNKVVVSKANTENVKPPEDLSIPQTMPTDSEYAKMVKSAPKPLVAEKFADPEKSGIAFDIKKGIATKVEIKVTSK